MRRVREATTVRAGEEAAGAALPAGDAETRSSRACSCRGVEWRAEQSRAGSSGVRVRNRKRVVGVISAGMDLDASSSIGRSTNILLDLTCQSLCLLMFSFSSLP